MKLTLIRHAQSMGNSTGNYSLLESDSLSEIGRQQAVDLSRALEGEPFDKIIVSPLIRALETLAPYLEATGQQAEIWPEIAEMRWHIHFLNRLPDPPSPNFLKTVVSHE